MATLKTITGKITGFDGSNKVGSVVITPSQACYIAGTQEIVPSVVKPSVAADGSWTATLYANADLTPTGTFYTVEMMAPDGGYEKLTIQVPQTAGPFEVANIVTSTPTASPTPNHVSTLTVDGATTLTGAVAIGSTLNVTGATTLAGLTAGTTSLGATTATSFTGPLTGNASTATALQTPRAINGVNFDGTAAITVPAAAGTLTGATLAAGVTASSLTSVGVLASPHFTSPVVDSGGLTVTAGGATITAGGLTVSAGGGLLKSTDAAGGSAALTLQNSVGTQLALFRSDGYTTFNVGSAGMQIQGSGGFTVTGGPLSVGGALNPGADNTYTLGTGALRWSDLQVITATFGGNLRVNGNIGFGTPASGRAALYQALIVNASAGAAWGFLFAPTLAAAANGDTLSFFAADSGAIATSTFTGLTAIGLSAPAGTWGKSGTGTIANAYGIYATAPTIATNNYALYVASGQSRLQDLAVAGNSGFYGTAPVAKQTVTGSKGANAALTSLMAALVAMGLVTDTTT